jgi:hypothetical protein
MDARKWLPASIGTWITFLIGEHGPSSCAPQAIPWLVGLTITAAYWLTSSTSFANPAVTLARLHHHLRRHRDQRRAGVHRGAVDRGGDIRSHSEHP